MIKYIRIIFFSIILFSTLIAQTYDLNFVVIQNAGINGGNFDVKIQIKGSSIFKLASSNITFNFSNGLSSPSLLTAYNFSNAPNYTAMTVTEPNTGVASINIVYPQTDASFATEVSTSYVDVAAVRFVIADYTQTSSLTFRSSSPSFTNVSKCTGSGLPNPPGTFVVTLLAAGTWNNLDVPLPVELSTFIASTNQSVVNLKWQTKTEVNNYGFEVERKIGNGKLGEGSWVKIGFVPGNGNSNSPNNYSLTDKNPVGGSRFIYRLKQIDSDGKFEYSQEVEVELAPQVFNLYQNYPNPFNPSTTIRFALPVATKLNIVLYNSLGESLRTIAEGFFDSGYHSVEIDLSGLPSGVYIYRFNSDKYANNKKLLLLK